MFMSQTPSPEKIARAARVAPVMIVVMGVALSGLIFYALGFTGRHPSIAEGGIIAVVLLVADCLIAWFYRRRNATAAARRTA
jgi:hypothetical protein